MAPNKEKKQEKTSEQSLEQSAALGMKKYKVAVMGATSVGKTIFFGSYFNLVTKMGKGSWSVTPNPSSAEEIARIITALFQDRVPLKGTTLRSNISFRVSKLDMEVILEDLPGGYTQDSNMWDEQKIYSDLWEADGVLFFISAEDLERDPQKLLKDNFVFSSSIAEIRKNSNGKARKDVPIWFLFTKGDAVPEATAEGLRNKIAVLSREAEEKNKKSFLFPKGHRVKYYKVTAMGKWKDSNSLPDEYKPENVVEPMEDFLLEMRKSRARHGRMKFILWTAALMVIFIGSLAGFWRYDRYRLDEALRAIDVAAAGSRWDEAQKAADSFVGRWLPPRLLWSELLYADADNLYQYYEEVMYANLHSDIEGVDINKVPSSNPNLSAAVARVSSYLAQAKFREINPQNYEKVLRVSDYYEATGIATSTDKALRESNSPQEFFRTAQRALALIPQLPEIWRDVLTVKVDQAVRLWVSSVSNSATVEDIQKAISDAEQLAMLPNMPAQLSAFLRDRGTRLTELWQERIVAQTEAELRASDSSQEFFKAMQKALLQLHIPQLSERWRDALAVQIDQALRRWVNSISKSATVEDIRKAISDVEQIVALPNMPSELSAFLRDQKLQFERDLNATWEKLCNEWLQEASREKEFENAVQLLTSHQSDLGLPPEMRERLGRALNQRYEAFVNNALTVGDEDELQSILQRYSAMPDEQQVRIKQFLQALDREKYARMVAELNGAKDIDELLTNAETIQDLQKRFPQISIELSGTLHRLVVKEIAAGEGEWGKRASEEDFGAAKQIRDKFFADLLPRLEPLLAGLSGGGDIRREIDVRDREENEKLRANDFAFCKRAFNNIRTRQDQREIAPVVRTLAGFNGRWPSSSERQEIDHVLRFLETIQKEVEVRLVIVNGDFSNASGFDDTPDMRIEIRNGDQTLAKTETIKDKKQPNFNFSFRFQWRPNIQLTFVGIEVDPFFDDEVFKTTVYATGLFGYEKLTGRLENGGNSLDIHLEHTIPDCPWR